MFAGKPWLSGAAGLAVLTGVYWTIVALLLPGGVTPAAWLSLCLACTAFSVFLWRRRLGPAGAAGWLLWAVNSVLLAAIFLGANLGLDALKGPHRAKSDIASHFGGLELWFVLCPGATAVAVARYPG